MEPMCCAPWSRLLPLSLLILLMVPAAALIGCSDDSSGATANDDLGDLSFPDVADVSDEEPRPFTCDDEDPFSPNHSAESAYAVAIGGLDVSDAFVCPGYDDFYLVEIPAGGGLSARIDFANRLGDLDLYLLEEGRVTPEEAVAVSGTEEDFEELEYVSEGGGRYVLWVDGFDDAGGLYDLVIRPTCRNDDDCPCGPSSDCPTLQSCVLRGRVCEDVRVPRCGVDGYEPNNEMSAPFVLATVAFEGDDIGFELSGGAGAMCGDDVDYFAITFDEVADLAVELVFEPGDDLDLAVLDRAGNVIASSLSTQSNVEGVDLPRLAAGTYLIYVDTTAGGSTDLAYELSVLLESSDPCTSNQDCAAAPGRGLCGDGGCLPFTPEQPSPLGGICDSADDCADENAFCYTSGTVLDDNFCTGGCFENADCAAFENGRCLFLTGGRFGVCFDGCAAEAECPSPYTCADDACAFLSCGIDGDCGQDQACSRTEANLGFCRAFEAVVCDGQEPDGNDRTSLATPVVLEAQPLANQSICDGDQDWYSVTIAEGPAELEVSVDFSGQADLDVYLYDAAGRALGDGSTPDSDPEVALARYLPAGDYLVRVARFGGAAANTTYDLEVEVRAMEAGCTAEGGECLGLVPLRIDCPAEGGACAFLEGAGAVEPGGLCDSSDDCSAASDLCFVFDGAANGNNICTHTCSSTGSCADVPGTACVQVTRRTSYCLNE